MPYHLKNKHKNTPEKPISNGGRLKNMDLLQVDMNTPARPVLRDQSSDTLEILDKFRCDVDYHIFGHLHRTRANIIYR